MNRTIGGLFAFVGGVGMLALSGCAAIDAGHEGGAAGGEQQRERDPERRHARQHSRAAAQMSALSSTMPRSMRRAACPSRRAISTGTSGPSAS